jgi:hypothetical protein
VFLPNVKCTVRTLPFFDLLWFANLLLKELRTERFLKKIQKMDLSPKMDQSKNGTIRKCFSRAFQRMVMSVGFNNLKFLGQFLCDALALVTDSP